MLSVTEFNQRAEELLRKHYRLKLLLIEGEIANLRSHEHFLYFSLCDEKSTVRALMPKRLAENLRFTPENGLCVVAAGSADFYSARGEFQFRVTDMLPEGIGSIQKGFIEREKNLSEEGI